MDKNIDFVFDFMWKDIICTHVEVYKDGSVKYENNENDLNRYLFGKSGREVTRSEVVHILRGYCFDEARPDKRELLKSLGLDTYDVLRIVYATNGIMCDSLFWIRFSDKASLKWDDAVRSVCNSHLSYDFE